ncbi:MAG: FAD:protein FMN transferase [Porticoccaceae bacterium]|nr:FAD:protein FMN transferase [Porticoccaceae bacterium]
MNSKMRNTRCSNSASLRIFALPVVLLLVLSGCNSGPEIVTLAGNKFGTTYRITIVADQPVPENLAAMIDAQLDAIDQSMSTYKSASQISQFNRLKVGMKVSISEEFFEVLQVATSVWKASGGALDPSVGPLVNLWGFGSESFTDIVPSQAAIASAKAQLAFDTLVVERDVNDVSLLKTMPLQLDMSAVAKGYAVDAIANILEMNALPDYLVEIGGETRVSGYNPSGQPWKLAIETPMLNSEVEQILSLVSGAVATSGDYRNYFERDGERYSHIIDPRTGYPINHKLASVTVVADNCALADAWATAFMILGDQRSLELANQLQIPVFMLIREDDTFKRRYSDTFEPYLGIPQ